MSTGDIFKKSFLEGYASGEISGKFAEDIEEISCDTNDRIVDDMLFALFPLFSSIFCLAKQTDLSEYKYRVKQ